MDYVSKDQAILFSANRGQPLAFSRDSSLAGQAFHNIAHRLVGQDVPFMTLREPGVVKRILGFIGFGEEGQ